ncbi:MAG: hypothetical protein IJS22_08345 [Lachnospiraceae bacterium]|nr:hypothetical protein [Lachnospiraceae bacterium]
MFQIGDQVLYPESNALLECTIVSADLFDNVKSAGLSSEEIAYIASQSLYNTSITNPFLLLHVKIMDKEAIEVDYAVDYHGINMLQLLTKDILDDPWAGYLPEMVYYREHSNTKESDYFHYTIEPGEEKSFTVGFLLSDDLNADSGLVIHVGGDTALSTFVDLQIP